MKLGNVLYLIISIIVFASCSILQKQNKIIDLNGKKYPINASKPRGYILFSTLGCHDCHEVLNEYFEENNIYNNDSIEIIGYISLPKDDLKYLLARSELLILFNKYYPAIDKVYFSQETKDKDIVLLDYKIPNIEVPSIIIVDNKRTKLIESDKIFGFDNQKCYIININLKNLLLK